MVKFRQKMSINQKNVIYNILYPILYFNFFLKNSKLTLYLLYF